MLRFLLISAVLVASAIATEHYGHDDHYSGHEMHGHDDHYGGHEMHGHDDHSYGHDDHSYGHKVEHKTVHYIKKPIYKTDYHSKVVKTGESHSSHPVKEHTFSYHDYHTPGHKYSIPAVKTYHVTKPGYTTYKHDSIVKKHVTHHTVKGKTISTPIYKQFVEKKLVPIYEHKGHDSHDSYGHHDSHY